MPIADLAAFIAKWTGEHAPAGAERSNSQLFLTELCDVLGVPHPSGATTDPEQDEYVFEHDARISGAGGKVSIGKIDLYKRGAFLLESKQGGHADGRGKVGTARRDTNAWTIAMQDAYGQALNYAREQSDPPPFLVVCDVGHCFDLYACFDGSRAWRPFPDAQNNRLFVADVEKHLDTLRLVWTDPRALDPSRRQVQVTREVAAKLAELAATLQAPKGKHGAEEVARFLMRCLFTMFAEDVGLLPDQMFTKMLGEHWLPNPAGFPAGVEALWRAMNDGGPTLLGKVLRFNGGLFAEADGLPLTREQIGLLHEAALQDWSQVEPAIFGTLLERALDPKERHRLGAHFTPRAYVERLVRPTIEEPLRAEWDVARAETRKLVEAGKPEDAKKSLRAFHHRLCTTRVLDPACGTGNFLYISLHILKQLESEVFAALDALGDTQRKLDVQGETVTVEQLRGIEVKPWAREIAELVLWIGWLQWHFRMHGKGKPPTDPVLRDYHNIECRDAVLAWDSIEVERDEHGAPVTRWDGETMRTSPVTGEEVPDETATVAVERYANPRRADWPVAEFIVGNPPFLGKLKMLSSRGDGYVSALRAAYSGAVPDSADFVMYWWHLASVAVSSGHARRFGLVTTNSITQVFNRRVVAAALSGTRPVHLVFAIPDHPWVDTADGAAVRIAMSVGAAGVGPGTRMSVSDETDGESHDGSLAVRLTASVGVVHADLTIGPNVAGAIPLRANEGLTSAGVMLGGRGFVVAATESVSGPPNIVRPITNGSDLLQHPRHARVIDFYGLSADEARAAAPEAFQRVLDLVKPERDANRRATRRERWWLFSEVMPATRRLITGLARYVATPETSKHRLFTFLPGDALPEHPVLAIGVDAALVLAVLSSRPHERWARATGGHLGVGNDLRYNKTRCFDPFPFPDVPPPLAARIATLGEQLDAHRKRQQSLHPDLTITGMYNVLEKLRGGEELTDKDRVIHEGGLVSVLKQLHDDLDNAVLDAYGWPRDLSDEQLLDRLVALNGLRAEEERSGVVRWLRPGYQNPAGTRAATQVVIEAAEDSATVALPARAKWPKSFAERTAAVRDLILRAPKEWTVSDVAAEFAGAKSAAVREILETLAALGIVVAVGDSWRAPLRLAA